MGMIDVSEDANPARWVEPSGQVRLGTWGNGPRLVDVRSYISKRYSCTVSELTI